MGIYNKNIVTFTVCGCTYYILGQINVAIVLEPALRWIYMCVCFANYLKHVFHKTKTLLFNKEWNPSAKYRKFTYA